MASQKRGNRMSKTQKEYMDSFLEKNKYLIDTKIDPMQLEKVNNSWRTLGGELNKLSGAQKTVKQWKQALNEFKVNTRRKVRLIHIENTRTGGGPKTEKDLTDLEERSRSLLSKISIVGAHSIPEAGISLEEDIIEEIPFENIENAEIIIEENILSEDAAIVYPVQSVTQPVTVETNNPRKIPKRRVGSSKINKKIGSVEKIAENHEKCLRNLANSNNKIAAACQKSLSKSLRRQQTKTAVFKLRF